MVNIALFSYEEGKDREALLSVDGTHVGIISLGVVRWFSSITFEICDTAGNRVILGSGQIHWVHSDTYEDAVRRAREYTAEVLKCSQ